MIKSYITIWCERLLTFAIFIVVFVVGSFLLIACIVGMGGIL